MEKPGTFGWKDLTIQIHQNINIQVAGCIRHHWFYGNSVWGRKLNLWGKKISPTCQRGEIDLGRKKCRDDKTGNFCTFINTVPTELYAQRVEERDKTQLHYLLISNIEVAILDHFSLLLSIVYPS